MPKLDPRIIHLRDVTLEAIEKLMDSGFSSYKKATYAFFLRAKTHKIKTGFDLETGKKFYQAVIYWKRTSSARPQQSSTNLNAESGCNDLSGIDLW